MKRIFKYNAYIWAFCAVGWAYIGWQLYNDTALMLALGAGHETILDEFELSSEAGVTVKPDCMQALLEEIDARGGISQVLTAAGVSEDQLANLRDAVLIE